MGHLQTYKDKNGKVIEKGMTLKHNSGDVEYVYLADNGELGFNASNEAWLERHGRDRELYPLYQFDLSEWEIVEE